MDSSLLELLLWPASALLDPFLLEFFLLELFLLESFLLELFLLESFLLELFLLESFLLELFLLESFLRGGTLALALRGLSCAAARLFAAATASQHGKGEQYRHKERADPYPIVFELTSCHKEHILALKFAVGNSVSL